MNVYFERYAYPHRFITTEAFGNEHFVTIVIPAFAEEKLENTLMSLFKNQAPKGYVELIIVLNHSETSSNTIRSINNNCVEKINRLTLKAPQWLGIHIIGPLALPKKQAGVGLARKIGMDEAAYRFNRQKRKGLIVCLDGDSLVAPNYISILENIYRNKPFNGASIYYEHLIKDSSDEPIALYELHLRYYIQALKYANYPFAFHTIGSSMAVDSKIYQKIGGMNKRKAGEDFYFLHKLIPQGKFMNINSTAVYPSARISERVPFGTGRAMLEYQGKKKTLEYSYDFSVFEEVKSLMGLLFSGKSPLKQATFHDFINNYQYEREIENLKSQAKDSEHFCNRFLGWFNGFKVLKFIHFLRDSQYPNQPLLKGVEKLVNTDRRFKELAEEHKSLKNCFDYLDLMRLFEKTT